MTDPDWSKCPEATHFDPVDQNFLREVGEALLLFNIKRGWIVPTYTAYGLSIEECQRPLLRRPAWSGEGLPPIGITCEVQNELDRTWDRVDEVLAHTDIKGAQVAVFRRADRVFIDASGKFRPLRTPEEVAADERLHKLRNAHTAIARTLECFQSDIPAQAVCRQVIEAMIDAGYSKQVAP